MLRAQSLPDEKAARKTSNPTQESPMRLMLAFVLTSALLGSSPCLATPQSPEEVDTLNRMKQEFTNIDINRIGVIKVLGPTQQLRLYQLELLLDTEIRQGLLREIPLAK
jgi:hypothetical protein